MTTLEIAMKYAGAAGQLMGTMTFLAQTEELTADEIREELKKKLEEIEAELGKIS